MQSLFKDEGEKKKEKVRVFHDLKRNRFLRSENVYPCCDDELRGQFQR